MNICCTYKIKVDSYPKNYIILLLALKKITQDMIKSKAIIRYQNNNERYL